ncbi:hypothetical protein [Luteolibacter soli]|uniref:Uncharacterized protein n=1 Tax=Luteolibacter soli TaxID=3135280 RepID=A0ABU9ARY3_9BACT
MNENDRGKLLRDVMATGLAVRRRRRRKLKTFITGGCAMAACILLAMKIHPSYQSPAGKSLIVETRDPVPPPVPQPPQPQRDKDEALLESLAEAGPVIITMADGSRQLYLTRP